MVKNKVGGNRHKKMARKNVKADARKPKLRLAKDKCEIYAKVTKMFGNGMCEVICQDKVTRLLIIRRKFRGRNRRDNMVTLDNVVLVGIREWEVVRPGKQPKVDLLYTYSPSQVDDLVKNKQIDEIVYPDSINKEEQDDGIEFDRNAMFHDEVNNDTSANVMANAKASETNIKIVMPNTSCTSTNKSNKSNKSNEEEINWDDI
jgi:initiation factor 1A